MNVQVIGIDCATVEKKIGVALGMVTPTGTILSEARCCSAEETAVALVADWLQSEPRQRGLLAIDAPLGWPRDLSSALIEHRAGEPILVDPNSLFRRATDRFVCKTLKKIPLEIGADKIARTAHSALKFLADLRQRLGTAIPLAWTPDWQGLAAIEVYPAATLIAHKIRASNYKKPGQIAERTGMVDELRSRMALPASCDAIVRSADALDAAVCVLAAADFVRGSVHKPLDDSLARREGWIWVHSEGAPS
jgi:predicted nuclease with RNAse H fold